MALHRWPARVGLILLAASVLFVGGWMEGHDRVEDDLTQRLDAWLTAEGFVGVTSRFDGQDGTLLCASPVEEYYLNYAVQEGARRWGVRVLTVDAGCLGIPPTTVPPTTVTPNPTTTVPATTVPTNPTSVPTVSVPADPPVVSARFEGGVYTLRGMVADELQRNQLLLSAVAVVRPDNIVDELVVDASSPVDAATSDVLAALIRATPPNLVSGESGVDGSAVYSNGVFRDPEGRAAFESVALEQGVEPLLTARPDGAECDIATVAAALNDEVVGQPVQFRSGSATIASESAALLDRIALLALQCDGVTIVVTGHTDTTGDAAANQVLSEQRAAAVVAALVDRGLAPEALVAEGAGEREPIVVDGVEDQSASRRVEFTVTVD